MISTQSLYIINTVTRNLISSSFFLTLKSLLTFLKCRLYVYVSKQSNQLEFNFRCHFYAQIFSREKLKGKHDKVFLLSVLLKTLRIFLFIRTRIAYIRPDSKTCNRSSNTKYETSSLKEPFLILIAHRKIKYQ